MMRVPPTRCPRLFELLHLRTTAIGSRRHCTCRLIACPELKELRTTIKGQSNLDARLHLYDGSLGRGTNNPCLKLALRAIEAIDPRHGWKRGQCRQEVETAKQVRIAAF